MNSAQQGSLPDVSKPLQEQTLRRVHSTRKTQ